MRPMAEAATVDSRLGWRRRPVWLGVLSVRNAARRMTGPQKGARVNNGSQA